MKNKLIIFGTAFLLLCFIAADKLVGNMDEYNIHNQYNNGNALVEHALQQVDSIKNDIDDFIYESELEKSKSKEANNKADSVQRLLDITNRTDSRRINELKRKLKEAQDKPAEVVLVREEMKISKVEMFVMDEYSYEDFDADGALAVYEDSIMYNIIEVDSTVYIYDTIRVVKMDTVIIDNPKHVKKITKKYVK